MHEYGEKSNSLVCWFCAPLQCPLWCTSTYTSDIFWVNSRAIKKQIWGPTFRSALLLRENRSSPTFIVSIGSFKVSWKWVCCFGKTIIIWKLRAPWFGWALWIILKFAPQYTKPQKYRRTFFLQSEGRRQTINRESIEKSSLTGVSCPMLCPTIMEIWTIQYDYATSLCYTYETLKITFIT